MKSTECQNKRRLTENQIGVLETILQYPTGIYQTILAEKTRIEMCTVRQIVKKYEGIDLIAKERVGKDCRITPRNIDAIQQLLKNGNGNGNSNGKYHSSVPKNNLVEVLPDIESQSLQDSPEAGLVLDRIITVIPEYRWEKDYVEGGDEENEGLGNWTEEVNRLSIALWDKQVINGTVLLNKCIMRKKGINLQELFNYCGVPAKDLDDFLIMLAVLINDENAKKIKQGETKKIIKGFIIEKGDTGRFISVET